MLNKYIMRPFFCRVGSKTPIKNYIIKLIPEHKIYVEAFVGGGSIYFAKPQSDVEIINDLDKPLMSGYKLIKNITDEDITKLKQYVDGIKNKTEDERIKLFNKLVKSSVNANYLKLYKLILKYCNTFSSKGFGNIYGSKINKNKINKLDQYKERLKNTKLTSSDYKKIINKYDSKDTFFFLDPPYENSTGLYTNSEMNYDEMANLLSNIKGKFLLTLNSSKKIRDTFKNFNIKKIKVVGQGRSTDIGAEIRNELIITNY